MKLNKFVLALSLSASFGLIACGDDSNSASVSDGDTISCKVIDEGKTVGYELSSYGFTMKNVTTFNEDGSATTTMKEVFNSSYSKLAFEAACAEAKEYDDEYYDSFKCGDGVIEFQHTEEGSNDDDSKAMMKYLAELECATILDEDLPEMPNFTGGNKDDDNDDNDDDDSDNGGESDDGDDNDDAYMEDPADDIKCDAEKNSDEWTWSIGDAVSGYFFDGTTATVKSTTKTDMGSESLCKTLLETQSDSEMEVSCEGSVMVVTVVSEVIENADRDDLYKEYQYACKLMGGV